MRRFGSILLSLLMLAGCTTGQTGTPSASPSAPGPAGTIRSSASAPGAPSPTKTSDAPPSSNPVPTVSEPTWMRVADQGSFADAKMTGVAVGPGGYVAVGAATQSAEKYPADWTGAAWQANDPATAWRRVRLPDATGVDEMHIVGDAAGYVAWGRAFDPDGSGGVGFWFSANGTTWRRAPRIDAFTSASIGAVVRHGGEWFASGGAGDRGVIVLASPDGLEWRQLPLLDEAGTAVPPGTPTWSMDILVATSAGLVGFGTKALEEQTTSATLRSSDGRHWQVTVGSPPGGSVTAAITAAERVAALGQRISPDAPALAGWTSADGSTWVPASVDPSASLGRIELLAYGGAVSYSLPGGAGTAVTEGLWSTDGMRWRTTTSVPDAARDGTEPVDCTPGPADCAGPRTEVHGLTGTTGGLFAVGGSHLASRGYRAVVWVASTTPPALTVQLPAGLVARTLTDDLRVRSQPRIADDSAKYEPLLAKGTTLHVLEGPVFASGYWWYRVVPYVDQGSASVPLTLSGGASDGWVAAAGRDGTPWIGADEDVDCGPAPCPSD